MFLALARIAAAAPVSECAETYDTPALIEAIDSAMNGFGAMDEAGFAASRTIVFLRIHCNTDTFDLPTIGAVHRVEAMNAFLAGDIRRMAQSLAGMLHTDPGYQFPVSVVPEGHALRQQLAPASRLLREGGTRLLGQPAKGWFELDGEHSRVAPAARAALGQQRDANGAVVETRYLWPDEDLGNWGPSAISVADATTIRPQAAVPPPMPEPKRPKPKADSDGPSVPLLVATAAAVAAAGGLYGYSVYTRVAFESDERFSESNLAAMRTATNGTLIGSGVCAAAALGLGVGLVVTW